MRPLFTVFIALVFAACGPDPETGDRAAAGEDTASRTTDSNRAGEPDGRAPIGPAASPGVSLQVLLDGASDRDEAGRLTVLDALNPPSRVTIDTTENRHIRGQIDTLRTRQYDGMSITTYHVTGGKELMKSVTVTGDSYGTERGVHVGMRAGELERVLGAPGAADSSAGPAAADDTGAEAAWPEGTYAFQLEGPMPAFIHADVEADRVSRLQWNFPID